VATVVAGSAFAGGAMTTCTGDLDGTKITGNLDIPAGAVCGMWGEVPGNVTVEGVLKSFGSTYDKNVTVNGLSQPGSRRVAVVGVVRAVLRLQPA
jgi:hypothetical protein